jgi:sec-independent protein translocase protein TatB
MFDIAFSEVMIIAVVALIVIGPERLPRVARTLGHLFGRMQRYVNEVKSDIQREVELDELRKLKQTVEDSARSIETSVTQELSSVNQGFDAARDELRNIETLAQAQPGSLPEQSLAAGEALAANTDPAVPDRLPADKSSADTTGSRQP